MRIARQLGILVFNVFLCIVFVSTLYLHEGREEIPRTASINALEFPRRSGPGTTDTIEADLFFRPLFRSRQGKSLFSSTTVITAIGMPAHGRGL